MNNSPSSELFNNYEKYQTIFTNQFFGIIEKSNKFQSLNEVEFQEKFNSTQENERFVETFNGYYQSRNPYIFCLENSNNSSVGDFKTLFSKSWKEKIKELEALTNDLFVLQNFSEININKKDFEYDGDVYSHSEHQNLSKQLNHQIDEIENELKFNDEKIYHYFLNLESNKQFSPKLKSLYSHLNNFEDDLKSDWELVNYISDSLAFTQQTTPLQEKERNFKNLVFKEDLFKSRIKEILHNADLEEKLGENAVEDFRKYVSQDWIYFLSETYLDSSLALLFNSINNFNVYLNL